MYLNITHWRTQGKRARGTRAPLSTQLLSFHAGFQEKIGQKIG